MYSTVLYVPNRHTAGITLTNISLPLQCTVMGAGMPVPRDLSPQVITMEGVGEALWLVGCEGSGGCMEGLRVKSGMGMEIELQPPTLSSLQHSALRLWIGC